MVQLTNASLIFVFQRNICLIKAFIAFTGTGLVLEIFNMLKDIISHQDIAGAIFGIIGWVLRAYLFLVVWSFKAKVEEGEEAGGNYQGEVHSKREEREMDPNVSSLNTQSKAALLT